MKNNRDASVEFMRIAAILMVIGTHLKLSLLVKDVPQMPRVIAACVSGDGVALFWMILGCFFFTHGCEDYTERLKKLFFRVIIPLFVYSALIFYFAGFLYGGKTLTESFSHTAADYTALFKGVLSWTNPLPKTSHLWYLYVYILVVAFQPAIYGMYFAIRKILKNDAVILAFLLFILLLSDLSGNTLFEFSHHSINGVFPAAFFIMAGDVLYRNREKLSGKPYYIVLGILLYIVMNLGRAVLQSRLLLADPENTLPIYWYTSFGMLTVLFAALTVFSLDRYVIRQSPGAGTVISYIGGKVFYIYLIHRTLIYIFKYHEINKRVFHLVHNGVFRYQIVYTLIIFLLSFVLAIVTDFLVKGIRAGWRAVRKPFG